MVRFVPSGGAFRTPYLVGGGTIRTPSCLFVFERIIFLGSGFVVGVNFDRQEMMLNRFFDTSANVFGGHPHPMINPQFIPSLTFTTMTGIFWIISPSPVDELVGQDLGSSAAQSVILLIVVGALTVLQFRYVEKRVHY